MWGKLLRKENIFPGKWFDKRVNLEKGGTTESWREKKLWSFAKKGENKFSGNKKSQKNIKMKSKIGFVIAQLLLLLVNEIHCFNVDVNSYIRHAGQDGSMFGFSVTLHQEQQRSWWVVGPVSVLSCATSIKAAGHPVASRLLLNSDFFFAVATPWDTFSSETPRRFSSERQKII